jgi:hypothetical protein
MSHVEHALAQAAHGIIGVWFLTQVSVSCDLLIEK